MSTTAASLDDLLTAVRRLEAKIDAALRPTPKLLSKRAAARMLGVGRGSTLAGLIRNGRLRQVMGKIPAHEIDRLMSEGFAPKEKSGRSTESARAEAIAIDDLNVRHL